MASLRVLVVLALAGTAASVSDAAKSDGRIIALEEIMKKLGNKADGEYCAKYQSTMKNGRTAKLRNGLTQ